LSSCFIYFIYILTGQTSVFLFHCWIMSNQIKKITKTERRCGIACRKTTYFLTWDSLLLWYCTIYIIHILASYLLCLCTMSNRGILQARFELAFERWAQLKTYMEATDACNKKCDDTLIYPTKRTIAGIGNQVYSLY
jgi:hypothetical protein